MQKSVHTAEYASLVRELRAARAAARLSQRDLARLLKVTHTWVAKVESGERRIDVVEFAWFLSACKVKPVEAFGRIWEADSSAGRRKPNVGATS